jgi:C-terminal processing protease CtpA/Prc
MAAFIATGALAGDDHTVNMRGMRAFPTLTLQTATDAESWSFLVTGLVCDGPAARAGIQHGDEILAVNGTSLTGLSDEAFDAVIDHMNDASDRAPVLVELRRAVKGEKPHFLDVKVVRGAVNGEMTLNPADCQNT